jgi:DNA modification methylase
VPLEQGPLAPAPNAIPVARIGDIFELGPHRLICGDATDSSVIRQLMEGDAPARLILTDVPYNVKISGHVTSGAHREFAMASGEMTDAQFLDFNIASIDAALPHLCDGGVYGTFIDWRGLPTVHAAATKLGLTALNLVVWTKTNAGMGSLYRSMHELLPLFKKGDAPHVNNVALGKKGRWRSNVWVYPGASSLGSDARRGLQDHPTVKPTAMLEDALLDLTNRGDIVLDPFLGSGSTLIAADKTGRICRGVELDPLYVDVIIRRFEAATGNRGVLANTGETFVALAARRALAETPPSNGATSDIKEEVTAPMVSVVYSADRGGDELPPPSILDPVDDVDKIATGEGRNLRTKLAIGDFGVKSDTESDQSARGGEANPRPVAADQDSGRNAQDAMNIAIATLDSQDSETAAANDRSSTGESVSAAGLRVPDKSARRSDHGAAADGQERALATAGGFDEIERDNRGLADVYVARANEYIAGELALRAHDGPLDGMADPQSTLTEVEPSYGAVEVGNIPVSSENARKPKVNDVAIDAPDGRVPVLGVTLLTCEKSAGDGGPGVVIMEVDRNGPADRDGLKAGNVILEAGGKNVSQSAEVIAAIASANKAGHGSILLRIKTANTVRIVLYALKAV